eukprot:gene25485-biopygen20993
MVRGRIIRTWGCSRARGYVYAPALQGGAVLLGPQPQTYEGGGMGVASRRVVSGPHSWGPNPRHIKGLVVAAVQGGSSPPGVWASGPLGGSSHPYEPALPVSGPYSWGPNPRHMGPQVWFVASRRMGHIRRLLAYGFGMSGLAILTPKVGQKPSSFYPCMGVHIGYIKVVWDALAENVTQIYTAIIEFAQRAVGDFSGMGLRGRIIRHLGVAHGQGVPFTRPRYWAGPCSWGPNPRHIRAGRRLQAYGGRCAVPHTPTNPFYRAGPLIAGAPTPDIWWGSSPPGVGVAMQFLIPLRARATVYGPALQVRGHIAGAPTPDIWVGLLRRLQATPYGSSPPGACLTPPK